MCIKLKDTAREKLNLFSVLKMADWEAEWRYNVIALLVTEAPCVMNDVPVDETITRLTGHHFPSQKEASEGAKDKHLSKPCWLCYSHRLHVPKVEKLEICYVCISCPSVPGVPGLHPSGCLHAYHTQLDYTKYLFVKLFISYCVLRDLSWIGSSHEEIGSFMLLHNNVFIN